MLTCSALPAAPLHLLQDLAYRQAETSDLELPLPSPGDLADVSPLPLSIPVLLQHGIIPPSFLPDSGSSNGVTVVKVSASLLQDLERCSLDASVAIRHALQAKNADSRVTHHDLWRVCALLEDRMRSNVPGLGQAYVVVAS